MFVSETDAGGFRQMRGASIAGDFRQTFLESDFLQPDAIFDVIVSPWLRIEK
jgi:hypothetical protein